MFDDLSLADARALKIELRAALLNLAQGKAVAEIRYGEMGRKFHAASIPHVREAIADLDRHIDRLCGGGGAIFPAGV